MDGSATGGPVDVALSVEIERFLADEAALLDAHAYREWFRLLTHDVSYCVTTHVFRDRDDGRSDHAIVDEDWENLKLRVDQLDDPRLTLAENPGSLYRRFVTNMRADLTNAPDSYSVRTNVLVYKNRPSGGGVELYAAEREDLIRRVDGGLRIAARVARLDQTVLAAGVLSTLL